MSNLDRQSRISKYVFIAGIVLAVIMGSCMMIPLILFGAPGNTSEPAVFTAARNDDLAAIKDFKDRGGDLHLTNRLGQSLYYPALSSKSFKVANYLYAQGISTATLDKYQTNVAYYVIVQENSLSSLSWLLNHNSYHNPEDPWGENELFYGAKSGNIKAVEMILEYGYDPRKLNSDSKTASQIAQDFKRPDIANLIDQKRWQQLVPRISSIRKDSFNGTKGWTLSIVLVNNSAQKIYVSPRELESYFLVYRSNIHYQLQNPAFADKWTSLQFKDLLEVDSHREKSFNLWLAKSWLVNNHADSIAVEISEYMPPLTKSLYVVNVPSLIETPKVGFNPSN